jgi:hypothetical protein
MTWVSAIVTRGCAFTLSMALAAIAGAAQNARASNQMTPTECVEDLVQPAAMNVWNKMNPLMHPPDKQYDKKREHELQQLSNRMADSAKREAALKCVNRFSIAATDSAELPQLIELYIHAQQFEKARRAIRYRLDRAKTAREKADVLAHAVGVNVYSRSNPAAWQPMQLRYIKDADALGDDVLFVRVQMHYAAYNLLPESDRARFAELRTSLALARRITDSVDRQAVAQAVSHAYSVLATDAQARGDLDHAKIIADSAKRDLEGIPPDQINMMFTPFTTLGDRGKRIDASHWYNDSGPRKSFEPTMGRVTVIEFTSYG